MSSMQEARASLVHERVLAGVDDLLRRGEELTFARVARAAGVPERTVYRHFPTREDLMAAVFAWANEQVGFDGELPATGAAMTSMVQQVFPGFDRIAPVVDELLATAEGRRARLADLDGRRAAAESVVRVVAPHLEPTVCRQLAAVVQVLGTAATWQALRDFWGMDGTEAAAAVTTAIDLLLDAAATTPT
jgi:AcrR family transcriptional regulator